MLAVLARLLLSVSCSPREHHMAYLVEIWLLTVIWTSPERVVTSISLRAACRCSSCSPTATRSGVCFSHGSRSCSRPFSENLRLCRLGNQPSNFLVRRLSGGQGRSGGAVEWWSGGAVIQSVIPLLSWAVYSSVLCRESRALQISVLRLLLRSGDMVGALAFVMSVRARPDELERNRQVVTTLICFTPGSNI